MSTTKITNVILYEPNSSLHLQSVELLIDNDIISNIGNSLADSSDWTVDGDGAYVSSGWIDMHVHCYKNGNPWGMDADTIGCDTGVVCICDAGTTGYREVSKFFNSAKKSKTIIKAFLNIANDGLRYPHELSSPENIDQAATIEQIQHLSDFIVGIKVRASGSVMGEDTVTPFIKARCIADKTNKPIMVHFGNNPPDIKDILRQLKQGDILTHCFHGKPNGIIENQRIKEIVLQKRKEDVLFDVGHGNESFSYQKAKEAFELGFKADTISSDLHQISYPFPVPSLANVMSKMLEIGYSLSEIITSVTKTPAQILFLTEEFGEIKKHSKANLTLFKVNNRSITVSDSSRIPVVLSRQITPIGCLIHGECIKAKPVQTKETV